MQSFFSSILVMIEYNYIYSVVINKGETHDKCYNN